MVYCGADAHGRSIGNRFPAVGDYFIRDILLEIAEKIRKGRNPLRASRIMNFFPPILTQMINVGEESEI